MGGGSAASLLGYPRRHNGIVVALGGEPVELVVATDMSLQFLQVTETPNYLFRVYEKLALRIKEQRSAVVSAATDANADA